MKALIWLFVGILLVATNPSLGQHREKVCAVATEASEKELGDGVLGTVAKMGGVADVVGATVASSVKRVNLVVCSLGTLDDSVVSFGLLGCVIAW